MSDQAQGPGWWQASDGRWYPPQPQPPGPGNWGPPSKRRRPTGLYIAAGVVGLVVALIVIGAIAGSKNKTVSTTATTAVTAAPATAAPAPANRGTTAATTPRTAAPATTAPGPKIVYSLTGSGQGTTPTFGVPNEWQIVWTYDCSAFGGQGNFIVTVSQPPGKVGLGVVANDSPVNQLGPAGSGVQSYHYGGTVFLDVNSECAWTVKVTD